MALIWLLRLGGALLRAVPLRVSYPLARLAGTAAYYAWPGGRRRSVRNMLHVTGGDAAAARRAARRSFAYYALFLVDFLRFPGMTVADVRERVLFDGWADLERLRTGHGIVFVTMHFGNWDMAAAALAEHGFPVSVIADRFAHAGLNELVVGSRERLGMTIVLADRMGPGILRALQRNAVVALLIDVPVAGGGGVEVEFFGDTIAVSDGPARIALRAGAPVVVATAPRLGPSSDRFRGHAEAVAFTPTGERDADARALTQATMHALETMIRRAPEQWYIFRALWLADGAGRAAT